jgi:hypothetical protein
MVYRRKQSDWKRAGCLSKLREQRLGNPQAWKEKSMATGLNGGIFVETQNVIIKNPGAGLFLDQRLGVTLETTFIRHAVPTSSLCVTKSG